MDSNEPNKDGDVNMPSRRSHVHWDSTLQPRVFFKTHLPTRLTHSRSGRSEIFLEGPEITLTTPSLQTSEVLLLLTDTHPLGRIRSDIRMILKTSVYLDILCSSMWVTTVRTFRSITIICISRKVNDSPAGNNKCVNKLARWSFNSSL